MVNGNMKIFLVEDDPNLGFLLKDQLQDNNFEVDLYCNGKDAIKSYKDDYIICLLDVMLPDNDGFEIAEHIRKKNQNVPIIFLTAKSLKEDKIKGFKIGADDYITKPFSMEELVLRIQAVLKRSLNLTNRLTGNKYKISDYIFDYESYELKKGLNCIKLTSKEADLLKILAENINRTVERSQILNTIWGDDSYYNARSMDVYLTKLRKYLKDDDRIEIINAHGKGYKLLIKNLT